MIAEKSTTIIVLFVLASLLNSALAAIFTFLSVPTSQYLPGLLWFNALILFYAVLPERVGTAFEE
mgnify:CR=1 FL=1|tara:strand:- start:368 stop:562 length:195 start_codon:yes stop_codon:yes gene_type:complete